MINIPYLPAHHDLESDGSYWYQWILKYITM